MDNVLKPALIDGRVEIHPLPKGYRLDILGADKRGRPVRLATQHFDNIGHARLVGTGCAVRLIATFHDFTGLPA